MSELAPGADVSDTPPGRLASIDILRGLAILWVIIFHLWIDINLVAPPPADQYRTFWGRITDGDFARIPTALIDAIARIGFQGVPLFMMLSGLALYLSASRRREAPSLIRWYYARLRRVLVPYWAGFFVFLAVVCAIALVQMWLDGRSFSYQYHHGVSLAAYHVIDVGWDDAPASLLLVPRLLFDDYFGAYPEGLWFVAILVQYYLLFPMLRRVLDSVGPALFIASVLLLTVVAKGVLIATFGGLELESAPRFDGGWAPFRLYDFALGMTVGYLLVHRRALLDEYATSPFDVASIVVLGLLFQIGGTMLDDRQGYANAAGAPMVITGLTLLALPLIARRPSRMELQAPVRLIAWVGTISFAVLIINEPMRLVASLLRVHRIDDVPWWIFLVGVYVPVSVLLAWPFAILTGLVPRRAPTENAEALAPGVVTDADALTV